MSHTSISISKPGLTRAHRAHGEVPDSVPLYVAALMLHATMARKDIGSAAGRVFALLIRCSQARPHRHGSGCMSSRCAFCCSTFSSAPCGPWEKRPEMGARRAGACRRGRRGPLSGGPRNCGVRVAVCHTRVAVVLLESAARACLALVEFLTSRRGAGPRRGGRGPERHLVRRDSRRRHALARGGTQYLRSVNIVGDTLGNVSRITCAHMQLLCGICARAEVATRVPGSA